MEGSTTRLANVIEVAVLFVGWLYFAKAVVAAAAAAGVTLPDMPILRHTYLLFTMVLLLMVWLKIRGERWSDFGLIPFKARYLVFGLALAVVDLVLDSVVRSISTPLIVQWTGADPHLDLKPFAELKGNLPLFLTTTTAVWFFAGFGEEFLFRGYLLSRLAQILGDGRVAWAVAIFGQAALFGLAHAYQGPVGMFPIFVGAVVNGIVSVAWGRNLWPVMIAHGLVDTLGFTMLYLGQPVS